MTGGGPRDGSTIGGLPSAWTEGANREMAMESEDEG